MGNHDPYSDPMFVPGTTLYLAVPKIYGLPCPAILNQRAIAFVTRSDFRVSSILNGAMVKTAYDGAAQAWLGCRPSVLPSLKARAGALASTCFLANGCRLSLPAPAS